MVDYEPVYFMERCIENLNPLSPYRNCLATHAENVSLLNFCLKKYMFTFLINVGYSST